MSRETVSNANVEGVLGSLEDLRKVRGQEGFDDKKARVEREIKKMLDNVGGKETGLVGVGAEEAVATESNLVEDDRDKVIDGGGESGGGDDVPPEEPPATEATPEPEEESDDPDIKQVLDLKGSKSMASDIYYDEVGVSCSNCGAVAHKIECEHCGDPVDEEKKMSGVVAPEEIREIAINLDDALDSYDPTKVESEGNDGSGAVLGPMIMVYEDMLNSRGSIDKSIQRGVRKILERHGIDTVELKKAARKRKREKEDMQRGGVTEVGGHEEKSSRLETLPSNEDDLFIEIRKILRESLPHFKGYVDPSMVLSQFGLVQMGLQKYELPSTISDEVKEKLKAEVGMRVRLQNAKITMRLDTTIADRVEDWEKLINSPDWAHAKLTIAPGVNDYKSLDELREVGGFKRVLMDKAISYLRTEIESGGYSRFDGSGRDEMRRELHQHFNPSNDFGKDDAIELAWDLWTVHGAEAEYDENNPLYGLVNYGKKTEEGKNMIGKYLKQTYDRGFLKRWTPEVLSIESEAFARLARTGFDYWSGKDPGDFDPVFFQNGVLQKKHSNTLNQSPMEKMIKGVVAGRDMQDAINKMGGVKQAELSDEGTWFGWWLKGSTLVDTEVITEEEFLGSKLAFAKTVLWIHSSYNPERRGSGYNHPHVPREAYNAAINTPFFDEAESETGEFKDFCVGIRKGLIQIFSKSGNPKDAELARQEKGKVFI